MGIVTFSENSAFTIKIHLMAATATGAATPHAEGAGKLAGPNADAEAAVTATTANTLGKNPITMITKGCHGVAETAETDLTTFATAGPGTAKTQSGTHTTHGPGGTETARSAAAANTLRDHGMGIRTPGRDTAAAVEQHRTAITATTAATAKTQADRTATDRPGNTEAAVTAAATDTLRQDTIGMITPSIDSANAVNSHTACVATGLTLATHGQGTGKTTGCQGNTETTGTAAAANTLGKYAMGIVTFSNNQTLIVNSHRFAGTASSSVTTQSNTE